VTTSTNGSTEKTQIARVKAWNPTKRARYESVVVVFFDSGWAVIGLNYKYLRVPAHSRKTIVFKHAGYPTQPNAAHVRAYARLR
jgi:hypothetical protein